MVTPKQFDATTLCCVPITFEYFFDADICVAGMGF
jgi:hypothetical protein